MRSRCAPTSWLPPNEVARWVLETFGPEAQGKSPSPALDGAYPTREADISDAGVRPPLVTLKRNGRDRVLRLGPAATIPSTIVLQQEQPPTRSQRDARRRRDGRCFSSSRYAILWPARVLRVFGRQRRGRR